MADVEDLDADILEVGLALVEIFVLVAEVLLVADKFGSVPEAVGLGGLFIPVLLHFGQYFPLLNLVLDKLVQVHLGLLNPIVPRIALQYIVKIGLKTFELHHKKAALFHSNDVLFRGVGGPVEIDSYPCVFLGLYLHFCEVEGFVVDLVPLDVYLLAGVAGFFRAAGYQFLVLPLDPLH